MGNVYTVMGRLVQGDPYGMTQKKDDKTGLPRVKVDGTPLMQAFVALAVPKTDPQLPVLMPQLDNEKKTFWPKGEWQHRDFATKIEDGDSVEPNKKMKRNCDREGFPGCTVFKFGNGYAPKVTYWDAAAGGWKESIKGQVGPQVKIGDYVTIIFDVESNKSDQSPGVHLNHRTIAFEREGAAIAQEADYSSLLGTRGPGGAIIPPAAGAAHVASPPPPAASPPPSTIAAPGKVMTAAAKGVPYESYIASGWDDATLIANGMMLPPAAAPVAAPPPAGAAPPPPYTGFMETPAAPPVRIMLPKAGGVPYDSYIAQGWTDAQLVQHGMMAP